MMTKIKYILSIFTLVILLATACSNDNDEILSYPRICELPEASLFEKEELLNVAQDQVMISGRTLELIAGVRVDHRFGEYEARATISLTEVNSISLPSNILLIDQYVIKDDYVWFEVLSNTNTNSQNPHIIRKEATGGPEWEEHDEVLVIVRVINAFDCVEYYLKKEVSVTCDC